MFDFLSKFQPWQLSALAAYVLVLLWAIYELATSTGTYIEEEGMSLLAQMTREEAKRVLNILYPSALSFGAMEDQTLKMSGHRCILFVVFPKEELIGEGDTWAEAIADCARKRTPEESATRLTRTYAEDGGQQQQPVLD